VTRRRALFAGEGELVAVGVFEDAGRAPDFGLGFDDELHAFGLQDFSGGEEVVAPKGDGLELANAVFVAFGGEESQAGVGARDQEFDPALGFGEGLIGDDFEAEGFGEELQGNILIANGNAYELDATNHDNLLSKTIEKISCGSGELQSARRYYMNGWYSYDPAGRLRH